MLHNMPLSEFIATLQNCAGCRVRVVSVEFNGHLFDRPTKWNLQITKGDSYAYLTTSRSGRAREFATIDAAIRVLRSGGFNGSVQV